MFFHPKNLKSENNNPWFKPWFQILLHTQSIVCATVDSQCLEYLGYKTLYTTKIAKPLLWSGVMSFAMDLRNRFSPQKREPIYRTLFINWAWGWRRQKCGYISEQSWQRVFTCNFWKESKIWLIFMHVIKRLVFKAFVLFDLFIKISCKTILNSISTYSNDNMYLCIIYIFQ